MAGHLPPLFLSGNPGILDLQQAEAGNMIFINIYGCQPFHCSGLLLKKIRRCFLIIMCQMNDCVWLETLGFSLGNGSPGAVGGQAGLSRDPGEQDQAPACSGLGSAHPTCQGLCLRDPAGAVRAFLGYQDLQPLCHCSSFVPQGLVLVLQDEL